jgi:TfoX/Sxy family transcriptional regulator of competence genes
MAYDTGLEERIDEEISRWGVDVAKRKMFGGLGYFINRNMAFGVKGDELIVKADEVQTAALLKEPGMGPFEFGGRSMKAWLLAAPEVLDEDNLPRLLEISRDYTLTLPPK